MATQRVNIVITGSDKTSGAFGSVEKRLRGLAGTNFSGLISNLSAVSSILAGLGIAGVGVGITSFLKDSIKLSSTLEEQMSGVKAVLQATEQEIQALRAEAENLGLDPNLKVTALEASQAMEMLAKNGLSVSQILNGATKATVALANSTGANLAQSAVIASDAMTIFGIGASDITTAIDGITGVTVKSKFNINDYAFVLANVGGVASSIGVSFDELNATIATIAPRFKSGRTAGTGLRNVLTRLSPTSENAEVQMRRLGIITDETGNAFFTATGELKSMVEIIGIMEDKLGSLSTEDFTTALRDIFGQEGMSTVEALVTGGVDRFNDMMSQLGDVSATDQASIRMDNLAGAMEIFEGVVEGLKISIGDSLTPTLTSLTRNATTTLETFANGLVPVFAIVRRMSESLAQGMNGNLAPVLLMVKGVVTGLTTALAGLLLLKTITFSVSALTGAFLFMLTPIGAVTTALFAIGGIAGIVVPAMNMYQSSIMKATTQSANVSTRAVAQTRTAMSDFSLSALKSSNATSEAFNRIAVSAQNGMTKATNSVTKGGVKVSKSITNMGKTTATNAYTWGQNIAISFADGLAKAIGAVIHVLNELGRVITYWLQSHSPPRLLPHLDDWGREAMQSYIDGFGEADLGIIQQVGHNIAGVLGNFSLDGVTLFNDLSTQLNNSLADVAGLDGISLGIAQLTTSESLIELIEQYELLGTVSSEAISGLTAPYGDGAQLMQDYISQVLTTETATRELAEAQENLNGITEKYDQILSPISDRLNAIGREQSDIRAVAEIAKLEEIIGHHSSNNSEIAEARLEMEKLILEMKERELQAIRDGELSSAEDVLSTAQDSVDTEQERLDTLQAILDSYGNISGIADTIAGTFEEAFGGFEGGFESIAEGFDEILDDVAEFETAIDDVATELGDGAGLEDFQTKLDEVVNDLTSDGGIPSIGGALGDSFDELVKRLQQPFADLKDDIFDLGATWTQTWNEAVEFWDRWRPRLASVWEGVKSDFASIFSQLQADFLTLAPKMAGVVTSVVKGFKDGGLLGGLRQLVNNKDEIKGIATDFIDVLGTALVDSGEILAGYYNDLIGESGIFQTNQDDLDWFNSTDFGSALKSMSGAFDDLAISYGNAKDAWDELDYVGEMSEFDKYLQENHTLEDYLGDIAQAPISLMEVVETLVIEPLSLLLDFLGEFITEFGRLEEAWDENRLYEKVMSDTMDFLGLNLDVEIPILPQMPEELPDGTVREIESYWQMFVDTLTEMGQNLDSYFLEPEAQIDPKGVLGKVASLPSEAQVALDETVGVIKVGNGLARDNFIITSDEILGIESDKYSKVKGLASVHMRKEVTDTGLFGIDIANSYRQMSSDVSTAMSTLYTKIGNETKAFTSTSLIGWNTHHQNLIDTSTSIGDEIVQLYRAIFSKLRVLMDENSSKSLIIWNTMHDLLNDTTKEGWNDGIIPLIIKLLGEMRDVMMGWVSAQAPNIGISIIDSIIAGLYSRSGALYGAVANIIATALAQAGSAVAGQAPASTGGGGTQSRSASGTGGYQNLNVATPSTGNVNAIIAPTSQTASRSSSGANVSELRSEESQPRVVNEINLTIDNTNTLNQFLRYLEVQDDSVFSGG